ncbi:hypothetical protein ACFVZH_22425 [Streptomyces sp. NPDC059534]|uniref:hypothetical protein n=1 Tax=Streptomyces sp. NPDC059534 TaxID=3346859 RepID=UPI0036D07845
MNAYTVESPRGDFTGESVGVHFHKGAGRVDDSTKEGRAAIEYFRRQGYILTAETDEADEPVLEEEPETEIFDPADHDVADVLAYLDGLGSNDSDAVAEAERVLAAERDGKARKTILARGEQKQEEQQ